MQNNPSVSLILPIRNESAYIEQGLQAILAQDYPLDCMEILIADGMSTDDTREKIASLAASVPGLRPSVVILDNPGMIVPTGMNIALRQARGEIIVRVDGHTIIASDYVRRCVEALQRSDAENVGGRMNAVGENFFGKAVALATSTPFGIGNGRFHYSDREEWADTVYMGAWHRWIFGKIGLFDEELERNQDDEFNYRLRAAGGKILLSPMIKSEYAVRGSPRKLWRQYFQYGLYKVRVLQKHPRQMSLRQFVPPSFVLALLMSLWFFLFTKFNFLGLIVPALYLAANLLASLWTAARRGWKYFPLLPIVFAILHLSYGTGFLIGLVKFWNRWSDNKGGVPVRTTENPIE